MDLTGYAHQAHQDSKAWFPENSDDIMHHALGLGGEVGEVLNWIKKLDRGDFTLDDEGIRKEIGEEVIDVLIYALNMCALLGINPDKMYELKRTKNMRRFDKDHLTCKCDPKLRTYCAAMNCIGGSEAE